MGMRTNYAYFHTAYGAWNPIPWFCFVLFFNVSFSSISISLGPSCPSCKSPPNNLLLFSWPESPLHVVHDRCASPRETESLSNSALISPKSQVHRYLCVCQNLQDEWMKVQDSCCETHMILLPESVSENPEGQAHRDEVWRFIKGWWHGAIGDG